MTPKCVKRLRLLAIVSMLALAGATLAAGPVSQADSNAPAISPPMTSDSSPSPVEKSGHSSNSTAQGFTPQNFPPAYAQEGTNSDLPKASLKGQDWVDYIKGRLETARHLRRTHMTSEATAMLVELLNGETPEEIQQLTLLELGMVAQDENDLPRAQSVLSQFTSRWPNDLRIPEIILRQGQFFRQMGLNNLALAKFYAVMTAALALKSDQINYYQRLVLQAQMEIAETHYQMGKYADAAEFFLRLLKQNDPALNRPQTQFRLVRSLAMLGRHDEAAGQAEDYLSRFPDAPERPEVRFYFAQALKQLGRNGESLQQVLLLLQEQKAITRDKPEVWAYWQQRAGNEIANQLYREGDYTRALDIYVNLSKLDSSLSWQIPVSYQIGMTYERLLQPQKAVETYNGISSHEAELGTNATPGLKAVLEMARWRAGFLKWQDKAETVNREFAPQTLSATANAGSKTTIE